MKSRRLSILTVFAGVTTWALANASITATAADSAADAEALPDGEFKIVLGKRTVDLDAEEIGLIVKFIDEMEKPIPGSAAVGKKLCDGTKTLTFEEVVPLLANGQTQAICAKLAKHDDPVLRFVSNGILAGSGDSDAAKSMYDVIHSEKPSALEKRLIKTWCTGIGIHVDTDDAAKIFDHLRTAFGGVAKFKPGDDAPSFEATTAAGNKLSLKQLQGKVVVVHFWATWCGPCVGELASLQTRLKKYSEDDVAIIFVSLDEDLATFKDSMKKHQLQFNNVFDEGGWGGTLARSFGVRSVPFNVVIDRTGKIISTSVEDIDAALEKKSGK